MVVVLGWSCIDGVWEGYFNNACILMGIMVIVCAVLCTYVLVRGCVNLGAVVVVLLVGICEG